MVHLTKQDSGILVTFAKVVSVRNTDGLASEMTGRLRNTQNTLGQRFLLMCLNTCLLSQGH